MSTSTSAIDFVLHFLKPKELARLAVRIAARLTGPQLQAEAERAINSMDEAGFRQSGQEALEYYDAVESGDRKHAATVLARNVGRFQL
jgi:putative NIF3 family GTP cyclohydrolase 1 type 2